MAKGQNFSPERSVFTCDQTGVRAWRMTSSDASDTNFYFTAQSWTPDGKYFIFYSNRPDNGHEINLFRMDVSSGKMLQLTDEKDMLLYSASLNKSGQSVYYTAQNRVCSVNLSTLAEERILSLPKGCGAFLILSSSPDNKYLSAYFKYRDIGHIGYVDLEKKTLEFLTDEDTFMRANSVTLGFPQFSPTENTILYSHVKVPQNEIPQKMWLMDIGGYKHPLYRKQPNEWITHEIWMPDGKGILFINHPNAIMHITKDGLRTREVCAGKFWHASPGNDSRKIVADTKEGEIFLVDYETGGSKMIFSGIKTDEDKRHHPHPCLSPQGDKVLFWANTHGKDNLYVAEILGVEIPKPEFAQEEEHDPTPEVQGEKQDRERGSGDDMPMAEPDEVKQTKND